MTDKIVSLRSEIFARIDSAERISDTAKQIAELTEVRNKYMSKSGEFSALLRYLNTVPNEEKPAIGKLLNVARREIEEKLDGAIRTAEANALTKKLRADALDVTLSKPHVEQGGLHPISLVINDIVDTFIGMGFEVKDGPEIELDYYNFEALNIPKDHPARDAQDTFYISGDLLLRTQTSAVQVHTMEEQSPPIRIICPGRVYRSDDDATHSPMFHQIEGLVVDENITLCDLKGFLDEFARSFFGAETKTRLRPSYFPFTEPSVEVDLTCAMCHGAGCRLCKGTGWLEVLGAGVVNPAVLEMSGIDSTRYKGFAFGLGVERAAMIKYGIPDMRIMFENDVRYLAQYR